MRSQTEKSEFIAEIFLKDVGELEKNLIEIQANENFRAVILIFDSEEIKNIESINKNHSEIIKNFPIPVISAVMIDISKETFALVGNSHLCVSSDSVKFTTFEKEISAEKALEKGLINKITSPQNVKIEAFALAEKISELAPIAIRSCLEVVNKGFDAELTEGLKIESELFAQIFATEDMREGTRAFFEKRKPVFRGR